MSFQLTFIDLVSRLITHRLQKFEQQALTSEVLGEIYKTIKESTYEICGKCDFTLDDLSKKYVAQLLFKSLNIGSTGGEVDVRSHYMMNDIVPDDLPMADLRIIRGLFAGSDWEDELEVAINKRS